MPALMTAIRQRRHGGAEVLEVAEIGRPSPGPEEVLVRVRAASVNPADWKIRSGTAALPVTMPFIPGFDLSGTVVAVGDRVTRFRPGDEVFGMPTPFAGAYAQYVRAPAADLARKPEGMSHVQAAALASVGLTAWQALAGIARVSTGQRVLVHAAAGGVGHVAVQIAKARGAHVIGTARTANHAFLAELGVDELVDYATDDFATAVKDVDVVLDTIGGAYGPRSLDTLTRGGLLVSAVWDRPGVTQADALHRGVRFETVRVHPSADDLVALANLVEQGLLRVRIAGVLPLHEAAAAHRLSESGRVRGKLVLTPPNERSASAGSAG
ncbi:NADP-dependent oxidoreductase [Actinoplanes sp. NPDC024001]|uniref:NADP-dependent oxidoreductase n=1 Tax=Actinoplanes sp. NPDC024001 TaxID=3154598 RepID=UPI003408F193